MDYSTDKLPSFTSLLLSLVDSKSGVKSLLDNGLSYDQIAELIEEAVRLGLITPVGSDLSLTESGRKVLGKLGRSVKNGENTWIRPLDEYRIDSLTTDDVYLPSSEVILTEIAESLALREKSRE